MSNFQNEILVELIWIKWLLILQFGWMCTTRILTILSKSERDNKIEALLKKIAKNTEQGIRK